MRIEFEDATPRHNKVKRVITVVLVILFITLFGVLGIYYAKLYNFSAFSFEYAKATTESNPPDSKIIDLVLIFFTILVFNN